MPQVGDSKGLGGAGSYTHKPRECYRSNGRPKVKYPNKKAAKVAARLKAKDRSYANVEVVTYRCSVCGNYHNGHVPKGSK